MNKKRGLRLFAVSMLMVLLSATLQSCGLLEIFAEALGQVCRRPLEVTTTVDKNDGVCLVDDCSLRDAVITSNECSGIQTIRLPAGFYRISLTGRNELDAATGDLNITDAAVIEGYGGEVIVDGGRLDRVFWIGRLSGSGGEVSISGLTVQGGQTDGNGGGIYVDGSLDLNLSDVIVRANIAGGPGDPGSGGGIFTHSQLTAEGVTFSGNTAFGEGGGIHVSGRGSIAPGSTLEVFENRTRDGYGGGGIYSDGQAEFSGSIARNISDWTGGGVFNGGRMVISGASIVDNSAESGGGGIANAGNLLLSGVTIGNNDADDGGGLFIYRRPSFFGSATVTRLVDTVLEENHADRSGGGIFNSSGGLLIATRSDLYRNGAARGGGIFNLGEATFLEANIGGNTAGRGEGGGVWNRGLISLTRSTLAVNRELGGTGRIGAAAIWLEADGHVQLTNATISGHEPTSTHGGVITILGGSMEADHATITANRGWLFAGRIESYPAIRLRNSIVVDNGGTPTCSRPLTTLGGNMFENTDCGFVPGDVILIRTGGVAGIEPLANNGGRTMTHALQSGSPAVDAALADACLGTDQRGVARPVGGGCDIGAYEASFELTGEEPDEGDVIELNFNADQYTIERGECTNLRWQVSGADSITLLGVEVDELGTREVCPRQTTGYELFAENASEETSSYLEIAVTEPTDNRDLSCWHRYSYENVPQCYSVCPVSDPDPGGTCP